MTTYKFNHFSKIKGLIELDPVYWNTNIGIKNGEADRVLRYNAPLRIYGYTNLKQHREIGLGVHKYFGLINNIYDINEDNLNLKKITYNGTKNSDERFTFLEKLIKSYEYNGYYVNNYNIIAIFVKVNVKEVN